MSVDGFHPKGPLNFCSNFHPSPIFYDGLWWPTVEHAYQAAKTLYHPHITVDWVCGDIEGYAQIWNASTPGQAKRIGRGVISPDNWDTWRIPVMAELLGLKFAEGTDLAKKLLATGDLHLEETNWWGDRFWGVHEGKGQNMLGKLLMQIRSELRQRSLI